MVQIKEYHVDMSVNDVKGGDFLEFVHNKNYAPHKIEDEHSKYIIDLEDIDWETLPAGGTIYGAYIYEVGQVMGVDVEQKKIFVRFKNDNEGFIHSFVVGRKPEDFNMCRSNKNNERSN